MTVAGEEMQPVSRDDDREIEGQTESSGASSHSYLNNRIQQSDRFYF